MTIQEHLDKVFNRKISDRLDLKAFVEDKAGTDLEDLKSLRESVKNYINQQKFIDDIGARKKVNEMNDKTFKPELVISDGSHSKEQIKQMIKQKRLLDGYHLLKKLLRIIDSKIEEIEPQKDKRKKYSDNMKEKAKEYFEKHKEDANKAPSKKGWIEDNLIPYLSKKFDKPKGFFSESSIRKDWLQLTS